MSNRININLVKKEQKYKEDYKTFIDIDVYDDYESHSIDIASLFPEYANIEDLKAIEISDFDLLEGIVQNIYSSIYDMIHNLQEMRNGILINGNYYDYEEIEHILNKELLL